MYYVCMFAFQVFYDYALHAHEHVTLIHENGEIENAT